MANEVLPPNKRGIGSDSPKPYCCIFVAEPPIHIQILQSSTFLLRYDTFEAIPPTVKDLYINLRR